MSAAPKLPGRTIASTIANRPEIAAAAAALGPELIRAMFRVGVFVPEALLKMCGSLVPAHLMAQFIFVSDLKDTTDREGWSYLTAAEMKRRFFIGRAEQEKARRILVSELGILEEQKKGLPGKMHFRVRWDELGTRLLQFARNEQTSVPCSSEEVCAAGADRSEAATQASVIRSDKHLDLSESSPESLPERAGRSGPAKIHRGATSESRANCARLTGIVQKLADEKKLPWFDRPSDPLEAEFFDGIYRKNIKKVLFDSRRLGFDEQVQECVKAAVAMLALSRVAKLKALDTEELLRLCAERARPSFGTVAMVKDFNARSAELVRGVANLVARTAAEQLRKRTPTLPFTETV